MGPLAGVRILELPAIGPVPFAGMVLAGLGAEVTRIERPGARSLVPAARRYNILNRDRSAITLDLKDELAVEATLRLASRSDAVLEGWRPGVAERLGVGPTECTLRNARLVYGRMTGWGQHGPRSGTAGHDINYIGLSGALHAIGRFGEPPVPPLNLVGDFGGGGMLLVVGVLAALLETAGSGEGQVVDAAMTEGAALLSAAFFGYTAAGSWSEARGTNILDSGAPFYEVYETSDNRHMAVGAIEPQFYEAFVRGLAIDPASLPPQMDSARWPELRKIFSAVFKTRTREEWTAIFGGTDACVSPVLTFAEAATDEHNVARESFIDVDGVRQPAPAPRFSRSHRSTVEPPGPPDTNAENLLTSLGFDSAEVERLTTRDS